MQNRKHELVHKNPVSDALGRICIAYLVMRCLFDSAASVVTGVHRASKHGRDVRLWNGCLEEQSKQSNNNTHL